MSTLNLPRARPLLTLPAPPGPAPSALPWVTPLGSWWPPCLHACPLPSAFHSVPWVVLLKHHSDLLLFDSKPCDEFPFPLDGGGVKESARLQLTLVLPEDPSFSQLPFSLPLLSCSGLTNPQPHQARSCLGGFALAVPSANKAFPNTSAWLGPSPQTPPKGPPSYNHKIPLGPIFFLSFFFFLLYYPSLSLSNHSTHQIIHCIYFS